MNSLGAVRKKTADYKIVLLGDADVGKTTLLGRYLDGVFQDSISSTIGASFSLKQWGNFNIALWDTAGEERFSGLSSFYCRGAAAALLCYDVTNTKSFDALSERFLPLLNIGSEDCLKVIIGTKSDLIGEKTRTVPTNEGLKLAKSANNIGTKSTAVIPFFETSSKTGTNVYKGFELAFSIITDYYPPKRKDNAIVDLRIQGAQKNKTTDCVESKGCGC